MMGTVMMLLGLASVVLGECLFRRWLPKSRRYISIPWNLLALIAAWGSPISWPRFWVSLVATVVSSGLFLWNMLSASKAMREEARKMIAESEARTAVIRSQLERLYAQDLRK